MAAKENKILPFATNIESNDILTDEEYATDATRTGGNIIGIAKRRPNNKALKQATLLASALAQLIANGSKEDGSADDGYDVDDTITFEQMETNLRNVLVGIIEDTAGSDNTLVHIANNETITGAKTFSKKIIANGGVQLPSNAPAGDNDAATKKYVDDELAEVTGSIAFTNKENTFTKNQTFDANLQFTNHLIYSYITKLGLAPKGELAEENKYLQLRLLDSENLNQVTHTLAEMAMSVNINGDTSSSIRAYKNETGSSESADILVGYDKSRDRFYTKCLSPDANSNTTEIATTEWVRDRIPELVPENEIKQLVLNTFFPVGSIYMDATGKINPNTQFGGTWVKIENRFLYGQGTKSIGATGGAETVSLNGSQMPAHSHTRGEMNIVGTAGTAGDFSLINSSGEVTGAFYRGTTRTYPISGTTDNRNSNDLALSAANNWTGTTSVAGSGVAHENMPPYIVVAIWKRTA